MSGTSSEPHRLTYIEPSALARAYLPDEPGHDDAAALLEAEGRVRVTGTWTRVEVSGALVRAARSGRLPRGDLDSALQVLDDDLDAGGRISSLAIPQVEVEDRALDLVRSHGLRAMDAWHLAAASIVLPDLADGTLILAFASRDAEQARVAEEAFGFEPA